MGRSLATGGYTVLCHMEADQRLSRIGLEQFNLFKAFGASWLNATQIGIGREELLAKRRDNKHFSAGLALPHFAQRDLFRLHGKSPFNPSSS